ncbi:MAG: hypothetical protein ONB46_26055, partial [candidate division KSB1 bacterium]|nr:hypothetical protein [candidate division KSB1 bacterium]MDZ7369395.1 hypothetical protein [candidate division KSB1 bacterium]
MGAAPGHGHYHENAVAQASSLHADKMSALHFHRDRCANVHDNSSENTFVVSPCILIVVLFFDMVWTNCFSFLSIQAASFFGIRLAYEKLAS